MPQNLAARLIMLTISFSMLLLSTLISSLSFKSIATIGPIKNLATSFLILGNIIVAVVICMVFLDQETLAYNISNLSKNYKMYTCIFLEYLGLLAVRKNYEVNGNNVTAINFCMFFSLTLVPIISYYGSDILGFSDALKVNYKSQTEFWVFVGSLTALVFTYFIDKLKGHINSWFYLLITPLILSITMFLSAKLMQTNNPYVVSLIISIVNMVILTLTFVSKKEHKALSKIHLKPLVKIFTAGLTLFPLSTLIVQLIAVEFITLLKRIAQIISGVITDKIYGNENTINNKDRIVIVAMLSIGFTMYYLRG